MKNITKDLKHDPQILSGSFCVSGQGKAFVVAVGRRSVYGSIIRKKFPNPRVFGTVLDDVLFKHEGMARYARQIEEIKAKKSIYVCLLDDTLKFQNKRVCEAWVAGQYTSHLLPVNKFINQKTSTKIEYFPIGNVSEEIGKRLAEGITLTTTGKIELLKGKNVSHSGSDVDCALLFFIYDNFGTEFDLSLREKVTKVEDFPYKDGKKTVVVDSQYPLNGKKRVSYTLAYLDDVIDCCKRKLNSDGSISAFERSDITLYEKQMAENFMRVIVFCAKEVDDNATVEDCHTDCILISLLGVKNPLLLGYTEHFETLQEYNIKLRYITKLSLPEAIFTAQAAGIIQDFENKSLWMTGKKFSSLSESEKFQKLEKGLRIIAEATPEVKEKVVICLNEHRLQVVCMGNRLDDIPPMRKADLSIAMRTADEPTKDSAHIILLESDHSSAVEVMTGAKEFHSVLKNQFN